MTEDIKSQIKNILLNIFISERETSIKLKICDIINQTIENVYESNEKWDELIQVIYKNLTLEINPENLVMIECSLVLLAGVFGFVYDELIKNLDTILNLFKSYFSTQILSLRTRTTRTLTEIISYSDKKETKFFYDFIFPILETTFKCMEDPKEEANLKYQLKAITDICCSEPVLFKKSFGDLFTLMMKIAAKKDYTDEHIREMGFEVIVNLVERRTNLFVKDDSKTKAFIDQVYQYALEMDKEITDEWATPVTTSYVEEEFIFEENVSACFSFVDRLIEHLGDKYMLPLLREIIMNLLGAEKDFRYRYIGLLSISQMISYVDDMSIIENIFPTVFSFSKDPNPKIRYAAVNCINEMSESFEPHFQNNYHATVVPILIERVVSENVLRVQLESLEALNTFVDHAPKNLISEYLGGLLDNLFSIFLKDIPVNLRQEILESIAEIVATTQDLFAPYSEKCLKILLEYFVNIYTNKNNKSLYGNLIECITLIGPYNVEFYHTIVPDMIKIIVEITENIPLSQDPIREFLQEALERLIPILKEHFRNLLPNVVNSVLKLVQTLPDMPAKETPTEDKFKVEELFQSQDDEPKVKMSAVKTSQTEDIASSIELLNTTIEALQELFLPYVEVAQKEIFSLMKYYINEDVRQQAANTLPLIIEIIAKHSKEHTQQFGKAYISELIDSIEKEFDNSTMAVQLENLGDIIDTCGFILDQNEINILFEKILVTFDEVEQRRIKLLTKREDLKISKADSNVHKKVSAGDDEEEEDEEDLLDDIEKDIEEIETIQSDIADVIGYLFKTHKEISGDIVNKIITHMLPKYFRKGGSTFEIKMGIFLADDMIEFLGQEYLKGIWTDLARVIISFCDNQDCSIRQAASYGVGVFSQHTKTDFNLYAEDCLKALNKSLAFLPDSNDEHSWGLARDNAVASLGKIVKYQSDSLTTSNSLNTVVQLWVKYLPITYDLSETNEQHGLLADIFLNRAELIVGENYSNLSGIIRIFGRIYKTKYSEESLNEKIEKIIELIKSNQTTYSILVNTKDASEDKIRKKLEKFI